MTKADRIRKLWRTSKMDRKQIAAETGCKFGYVCTVIWRLENPSYAAEYMRDVRQDDQYYFRELEQQRNYRRKKAEARAS